MTVVNTVAPVITGQARQGQILSTSGGTWTYDLDYITLAYQWERCDASGASCVDISGATDSQYQLTSSDVGHRIRSEVTATEHTDSGTPPGGVSVDKTTMLAVGGTILRMDNSDASDPRPGLWGSIEAAFASRCQLIATGGDPGPTADGTSQGNTKYRQITVVYGDEQYGNNARAQLGRNERTAGENTGSMTNGTFALYNELDHKLTFLSMYFPTGQFTMNKNAWQTIINMKQTQPYGSPHALPGNSIQVDLWGGKLIFQNAWETLWETTAPVFDTWIRFAFDVTYSKDPTLGRIQFFVDRDGDGDFLDPDEFSPVFTKQNLIIEAHGPSVNPTYLPIGSAVPDHLRVGIYHDTSYPTSVVGIDNVQVVG